LCQTLFDFLFKYPDLGSKKNKGALVRLSNL
jgi:hypothetical protein